jgi:hypothetical protein
MVGVGKTKLIAVLAYEMILVVASLTTADVAPVVKELVVVFIEDEVVFVGGTIVTKTLDRVAPGTPPVVVDVETNDDRAVFGVDRLIREDSVDVKDEGQENMFEPAVDELATELVLLEATEDTLTVTNADVGDGSVIVVMIPETTCVTVYVANKGTVVAAALLGPEEGFGKEIVKPTLVPEVPGLEGDNIELPGVAVRDGKPLVEDDAPIGVGDSKVLVIVCPVPERVVVYVVKMLEIMSDADPDETRLEDGFETVPEVMVGTVGDPPGSVLVKVTTPWDGGATG